jgi:competence protein ComEC
LDSAWLEAADRPRVHDLRLAVGAVAAWVVAALALSGGVTRAIVLTAAAAAIGVLALAFHRRGRAVGAVIALAAFCVVLVLAPLAARLAITHNSTLTQLARQRTEVTADVTLTSDPHPLAAKGTAGSPRAAVEADVNGVVVAGRRIAAGGHVLILGPAGLWHDVLPGQRLAIDATLQPPLGGDLLTATLTAEAGPQFIGRPPWWQRGAGAIRSSMRAASATLPSEEAGLLPGLIDGDTTQLDPVLAEHFRIAGLTHLVAVSGTNCAIVVGAVLLIARRSRAGPRGCAIAGAIALLAFVAVARPSPSVLRAAVMAAIALWCMASGRERVAVPALSATALVLLVWQPQLAADAGFAMSALATAALLLIAPGWAEALRRRGVPGGLAEALAVAAAANVVTAPVIAAISGRISLISIPANLLAEPVVAAVTVIGFAAALVAPFSLPAGAFLAQLAGWPCRWLIWVANFFGGLHGATIAWPGGTPGGLALLAVVLALLWVGRRAGARRSLTAFAVVALVVLIPVRAAVAGWPPPGWIFVACDVRAGGRAGAAGRRSSRGGDRFWPRSGGHGPLPDRSAHHRRRAAGLHPLPP